MMVFEASALLSLSIDAIVVMLYFEFPAIYSNNQSRHNNNNSSSSSSWRRFDVNPLHTPFIMVLLAGLRIVFFIPNVLQFQRQLPLMWKERVKLWLCFNMTAVLGEVLAFVYSRNSSSPEVISSESSSSWYSDVECVLIAAASASTLCQYLCYMLLSSSVSMESRRLSLSMARNLRVASANSGHQAISQQDNMHAIVIDDQGQENSSLHLDDILSRIMSGGAVTSLITDQPENNVDIDVLELLVRLFTYDNSLTEGATLRSLQADIRTTFAHNSAEVIFFIPQFANYLHNSLSRQVCNSLQDHLLQLCQTSLSCAHRLHWYINATFIQDSDDLAGSSDMLLAFLSMVEDSGEIVAKEMAGVQPLPPPRKSPRSQRNASQYSPRHKNEQEGFTPLLIPNSKPTYLSRIASKDPRDYPLQLSRIPPPQHCKTYFQHNISFWNHICDISSKLASVPRRERNAELQARLNDFCPNFLPSACCYAPLRRDTHRIWSVVIDECFAFNTNNRAPIFLCLEIVYYDEDDGSNSGRQGRDAGVVDIFSKERISEGSGNNVVHSLSANRLNRHSTGNIATKSRRAVVPAAKDVTVGFKPITSYGSVNSQFPLHQLGGSPILTPVVVSPGSSASSTNSSNGTQELADAPRTRSSLDSYLKQQMRIAGSKDRYSPIVDIGQWSPRSTSSLTKPSRGASPASNNYSPDGANQVTRSVSPFDDVGSSGINTVPFGAINYSSSDALRRFSPVGDEGTALVTDEDGIKHKDLKYSSSSRQQVKPTVVFKERWRHKENRIRRSSPVGECRGWRLLPVIVKSRDNLRQEQLISQLIRLMHDILQETNTNCCWLHSYDIVALSADSGLVEAIPDTVSLDVLKRSNAGYSSLKDFFEKFFIKHPDDCYHHNGDLEIGGSDHVSLDLALDNYLKSLAGYSIVCYLLQIKDRHNGNILLDIEGHIIHIDFGFVLGNTPGGNIGFEKAPFKLTNEMVEVLQGFNGSLFHKYSDACVRTFMALRQEHHRILLCLEMIAQCSDDLPCFAGNAPKIVDDFRVRFRADLHDQAAIDFVHELVDESLDNWRTKCYDGYQRCCVGIF